MTNNATDNRVNLINLLEEWHNYHIHKDADPRTKEMFLMNYSYEHFFAIIVYAVLATYVGPHLMQKRKAFELKGAIRMYNIFQVVFNLWLVNYFIKGGWFNGYSLGCQPVDRVSPQGFIMAKAAWWFFISKYIDYIDTIFFVLRKKYSQLTFLHLAHHGCMPFFSWYTIRFVPGGIIMMIPLLNSFIHVIMYSYYFLAALGPTVQKYLWWKKYLTIIQMAQFVFLLIHHGQLFFIDCDFPAYFRYWGCLLFGPWIFFLFFFFYRSTYNNPTRAVKAAKEDKAH